VILRRPSALPSTSDRVSPSSLRRLRVLRAKLFGCGGVAFCEDFFWPQKNAENTKKGNFIFAFLVFFRGYGLGCGLAPLQCHLPESLQGATIL
jgi:hypothetical protein